MPCVTSTPFRKEYHCVDFEVPALPQGDPRHGHTTWRVAANLDTVQPVEATVSRASVEVWDYGGYLPTP